MLSFPLRQPILHTHKIVENLTKFTKPIVPEVVIKPSLKLESLAIDSSSSIVSLFIIMGTACRPMSLNVRFSPEAGTHLELIAVNTDSGEEQSTAIRKRPMKESVTRGANFFKYLSKFCGVVAKRMTLLSVSLSIISCSSTLSTTHKTTDKTVELCR